jgi:hypothetical protein
VSLWELQLRHNLVVVRPAKFHSVPTFFVRVTDKMHWLVFFVDPVLKRCPFGFSRARESVNTAISRGARQSVRGARYGTRL